MKVVLDTDVVVASLRSAVGASRQLLHMVAGRRLSAVISVPLMLEYESVVMRQDNLRAANISAKEADAVLDMLAARMEHTPSHFLWRPQVRDPHDDMVLEAAVNGGADVIVTFNVGDYGTAPLKFGIECSRPGDVLRRV